MKMSQADHGRLARNTIFLYLRLVLILGISLFTSRQVLAVLGVEDYGIYNVVAGAIVMLSFLNGAMATSTQRFLSIAIGTGRADEVARVFGSALLLHLAIAAIVCVIAETVGLWLLIGVLTIPEARADAARWVFQFALLSFLINIVLVPYMAAIIANERMELYAYLSIFDAVVKLVNVYILMYLDHDKLVLYGILNAFASMTLLAIYVVVSRRSFPECRMLARPSATNLREMSVFVGWNTFAHVGVAAGVQGVNILLNMYFGPVVNAARGIALLASDSIKQFAGAFQIASAPQITKTYASGNLKHQRDLILFACKSTFFLLLLPALPVFMEADKILSVWLGKPPPESALFLRLMLVDALICTSANPMYYGIMASGNIGRYQLAGSAINVGNAALCWGLLAIGFPAYSVFCVLLGISVLMLGLRLWFLSRRICFSASEYARQVLIPGFRVVVTGTILPLILLISFDEGLHRLIMISFVSLVGTALSIYFIGLNPTERSYIRVKFEHRLRKRDRN